MRKIVLVISFALISLLTFAQAPLSKGDKQLNAGVGLSGWGIPLYVGMDFGVHKDITVGFEGSVRFYPETIRGTIYTSRIFGFYGTGNYHFNRLLKIPSKFDVYAGLNLGFYIWSSPAHYPGSGTSDFGVDAHIGGRFFFSKNFGINLELGADPYGNLGGGKFGITYIF